LSKGTGPKLQRGLEWVFGDLVHWTGPVAYQTKVHRALQSVFGGLAHWVVPVLHQTLGPTAL
jgi:hypothetical protein